MDIALIVALVSAAISIGGFVRDTNKARVDIDNETTTTVSEAASAIQEASMNLLEPLQKRVEEDRAEIRKLNDRIDQLEENLHEKDRQLGAYQKLIDQFRERTSQMEDQLREKNRLINMLQAANLKLQTDQGLRMTELEAENKELRAGIEELTEQLEKLSQDPVFTPRKRKTNGSRETQKDE